MELAEADIKPVPKELSKKVPSWNGAGARAYPAIAEMTTKPKK